MGCRYQRRLVPTGPGDHIGVLLQAVCPATSPDPGGTDPTVIDTDP
jgi:hypothetical protein